MENHYTVRQVQDILKVDRITVYRMLNDGRLRGIKIGSQWRFPHSEIERLLGGQEEAASTQPQPAIAPDATFPTHCIQTIQNLFSEISRLGAVVVDMDGKPLTVFSRPAKFCSIMMSSSSGREACQNCWKEAVDRSVQQNKFVCHAGFFYLATPLYDRGNQIGTLLTGPFYWQQPDRYEESDRVQRLASQHRLDKMLLQESALDVQIIPVEKHSQVETWPRATIDAMHSILNERSGFLTRLQQIADLTQVS
jgi:excisionase family DNA binding protein